MLKRTPLLRLKRGLLRVRRLENEENLDRKAAVAAEVEKLRLATRKDEVVSALMGLKGWNVVMGPGLVSVAAAGLVKGEGRCAHVGAAAYLAASLTSPPVLKCLTAGPLLYFLLYLLRTAKIVTSRALATSLPDIRSTLNTVAGRLSTPSVMIKAPPQLLPPALRCFGVFLGGGGVPPPGSPTHRFASAAGERIRQEGLPLWAVAEAGKGLHLLRVGSDSVTKTLLELACKRGELTQCRGWHIEEVVVVASRHHAKGLQALDSVSRFLSEEKWFYDAPLPSTARILKGYCTGRVPGNLLGSACEALLSRNGPLSTATEEDEGSLVGVLEGIAQGEHPLQPAALDAVCSKLLHVYAVIPLSTSSAGRICAQGAKLQGQVLPGAFRALLSKCAEVGMTDPMRLASLSMGSASGILGYHDTFSLSLPRYHAAICDALYWKLTAGLLDDPAPEVLRSILWPLHRLSLANHPLYAALHRKASGTESEEDEEEKEEDVRAIYLIQPPDPL